MKKILTSLTMVILVGALAIGATWAFYYSDLRIQNNTFASGTVSLGGYENLPLNFTNLAPNSEVMSDIIRVRYNGSLPADLYVGFKDSGTSTANFVGLMEFAILEVTSDGTPLKWWVTKWSPIANLFIDWTQVGDNVSDSQRYFRVYIRVGDLPNTMQGTTSVNQLIIYAVQDGGGKPNLTPENY